MVDKDRVKKLLDNRIVNMLFIVHNENIDLQEAMVHRKHGNPGKKL